MEKRYQIFISSTYADLIEERKEIMEAILALNCFPAGMEMFPATNMEQFEYIKKVIDMSDYYVLVIAGRYGSLAKDGTSYTEKEYNYAKRKNIPILVFIYEDIEKLPLSKVDNNMEKLEKFRNKVKKNRIVKFWNNALELKYMIYYALLSEFKLNPREGWIKDYQPQMEYNNLETDKENKYIFPDSVEYPLLFEAFRKNKEVKQYLDDNKRFIPIGINIKNSNLVSLDLSKIFCFGIAGKSRTGKSNTLKVILSILQARGEECYVIELNEIGQEFKNFVSPNNYLDSCERIYDFFVKISPQLKERNSFIRECRAKNYTDERVYNEVNKKFSRIYIFIDNVTEFIKKVHGKYNIHPFLETIIKKGKQHNIYFFFGYDSDLRSDGLSYNLFNLFVNSIFLHLGGNIASERFFNTFSIPYIIQNKRLKKGVGLLNNFVFAEDNNSIFDVDDIETIFILIPKFD